MATINLVVGDWSSDGHGKTDTYSYEVNKSQKEIEAAHKKSCNKYNIRFNSWCEDYEDNSMPLKDLLKIQDVILSEKEPDTDYSQLEADIAEILEDNEGDIDYDDISHKLNVPGSTVFASLYLGIAKLSMQSLTYTPVESDEIKIGGYGLFW